MNSLSSTPSASRGRTLSQGTGACEPGLVGILRWLTSITRPVHAPLVVSTLFRFANLGLDMALFGYAAYAIALTLRGEAVSHLLPLIILIAIGKAFAFYCEQFTGHYVAFKALELLRGYAFARLWPKAPGIVTRSRSGDVLSSLTRDVDRIEVVYAHTFAPVISAVVVPTTALIAGAIAFDWRVIAIPAICYLLSMTLVPWLGAKQSFSATDAQLSARGKLASHISDSVFGVEEVVGYGLETQRLIGMADLGEQVARSAQPAGAYRGMRRGLNITLALFAALATAVGAMEAGIAPAIVVALTGASLRLFEGPKGVEDAVGALDASIASARRIWRIAHTSNQVSDNGTQGFPAVYHQEDDSPLERCDRPLDRDLPRIAERKYEGVGASAEWRGVWYAYPSLHEAIPDGDHAHSRGNQLAERADMRYADSNDAERHYAIRDANIRVAAGTHVAFVGRSGSGKTTLAQLLLRFDDPQRGKLLINGVDARDIRLDELRKNIALVSQKSQILDTTIADNLRLGAPRASDDELWHALEIAHLADEVRVMPSGMGTRTGQDGSQLSGGQVQRLALARALLMQPRVIVLDEFSANLNIELENDIRRSLKRESPGITIIEITHRLFQTIQADAVYICDRGMVRHADTGQRLSI
ncbi:MAG: ABC transporter ATP-binding protein [Actinomycetaceae bacterium]|nr:ABC transporter ATP-binding protein/permease [Arcanobacterium sp.]MDD7505871.1 ABC transporter ATP-binding protein [Actinomycetaceae bacterium]MDY6143681.1 ABC transporter ATP-binding protein [Arcanobacterium sp.]